MIGISPHYRMFRHIVFFHYALFTERIMERTTEIIKKYLYVKDSKRCYFHIKTYDIKCHCLDEGVNHTSECFITGWNPMPVAGKFYSSLGTLHEWMINNGWHCNGRCCETIIVKEKI